MHMNSVKAFAPASIGNIGIGFDIMGLALNEPGDEVVARLVDAPGLRIAAITGDGGRLPLEVEKNTAGVAALRLLEHLGQQDRGIELEIHKKLPLGSGLGSSAASAAAAVLAVSELLHTGMNKRELLPFACLGEQVASGGFHADNAAPSLLGGIILIRDNATLDVHRLYVPKGLYVAVVHPNIEVLTKEARAILKQEVPLRSYVRQTANIGAFIIGLFNSDIPLLGRCLNDEIIEPQRAALIPGFYDVKNAALAHGVLGCSISGAGPSVFALCANSLIAEHAGIAMREAFEKHHIASTLYLSPVNQEGAMLM
jgi:homoserine kinase